MQLLLLALAVLWVLVSAIGFALFFRARETSDTEYKYGPVDDD